VGGVGSFGEFLAVGGWVMYIILLLSIVAVAVAIERFIALQRARINVSDFLAKVRKALLVNRSVGDGIKICEQYRGPVASIMKAGLLKYGQPKEDVEKTIENASFYEMSRLERGLIVLATVANVAPLVGFLGTVLGMIQSFDALAAQGLTNPGAVADGIKVALYTTAFGLMVAVPVQLIYNFFISRINRFVRDIETAANTLVETYAEMERSGVSASSAPTAAAKAGPAPK